MKSQTSNNRPTSNLERLPAKVLTKADRTIKIVGPYFTNYSLAKVNRGIALGINSLQSKYKTFLYCSADRVDYMPTKDEVETKKTEIKDIVLFEDEKTDFAIYNNFPKSLSESHGLKDLNANSVAAYVAWEESIYPENWVNEINENAHFVLTISKFVKDILKKSGVKLPIFAANIALDDIQLKKTDKVYNLNTNKKVKFLHISTAKKRKGVDVLIKAYFEEFANTDDVVLILKTSPGPDNNVNELIEQFKKENSPEVLIINNSNLTEEEMSSLHNTCDLEIYPSRAEGFGLPILEAMYHGKPVIVTNYSGQTDFINSDNAILLDYEMEYAKDSELGIIGSRWAEPDVEELMRLMRDAYNGIGHTPYAQALSTIASNAQSTAQYFTWENSAKRVISILDKTGNINPLKSKSIAMITPINTQDGIAVYTKNLCERMESNFKKFYYLANKDIADKVFTDNENVERTWEMGETTFSETLDFIKENNIDIVHIQYHSSSYYAPENLSELIKKLTDLNKEVFVTLHSVIGQGFDHIKAIKNLRMCKCVIIHNRKDYEYAKENLENVILSPLGIIEFSNRDGKKLKQKFGMENFKPIIATHGLINKNKGIPNVIEAISILKKDYPDILFLSINALSSNNAFATSIFEECKQKVKDLGLEDNVIFIPEFISNEQLEILVQLSDFNVLAYEDAGESASDAVRKFLASKKPTVVTDIPMFNEFSNEVLKIANNLPDTIAEGLKKVIENTNLQKSLLQNAKEYIDKHNFDSKALEHLGWYVK